MRDDGRAAAGGAIRVAIVESLPYEMLWNGDGVYLDGVRRFLTDHGCDVTTFVTDIGHRGPRVALRTRADATRHRWRVRQAVQRGPDQFLSYSPTLLPSIAAVAGRRLLARAGVTLAEPSHDRPSRGAHRWVRRELKALKPDLVIYYLGAIALLDGAERPWKAVALGGWLRSRWIAAGTATATPLDATDQGLVAAMRHADQVDIRFVAAETGMADTALWGMSFPPSRALAPSREPVVLYVGAKTGPNREGLDWLLAKVWPQVLSAVPAARLRLVGGMARGLASDPVRHVEVAGFVDDLADEYARAQLVVAPILSGTHGAKTKVAEALGFGRPLVTTSVGIDRGAPNRLDEAVDVADDPAGFAAAIIALLRDEARRAARTEAAGAIYRRVFANDVAYAPLRALLDSLAASGPAVP